MFLRATLAILTASAASFAQIHFLPATDLLLKPANLFDLNGRTVRYTPAAANATSYRVESLPLEWQSGGTALGAPGRTTSAYAMSWTQPVQFAFPFAGRTFNSVFVNLDGNISFGSPETSQMPANRNPWPDGTVRGMAATLDARALGGSELLIAPLWQLYSQQNSRVLVNSLADRLVVTWDVERAVAANSGYTPLGRNSFQAVLYANGRVDLSYERVLERDGIAGLFQGVQANAAGTRVDNVSRPETQADPVVAVKQLELTDLGSALRWRFTMGANVPTSVPTGQLWYRVFLTLRGAECEVSLGYTPAVRTVLTCGRGGSLAYRVDGSTVDLIVSKLSLDGATSFSWGSDVVWFGFTGRFDQVNLQNRRPVQLSAAQANPEADFSALASGDTRSGDIYEVFHYPSVNKDLVAAPRAAYKRFAPDDDFFVPALDFRPDDLFNHGPSTGQLAAGGQVGGIGGGNNGADVSSRRLQVTISPLDYNGQRLRERVNDGRREYFNYAQAVGWISHELTHRWTAYLNFRNPATGANAPLNDGSHWLPELNVASVHNVWDEYSFSQYPERSVMDGGLYEELGNNRFRMRELTYIIPAGFTGLDLYAMGLVSPEEMPETYLIANRQPAGGGDFTGTKIPVRGADVVAAMGARSPSWSNAQKSFRLGVYLFHDPAREPDPVVVRNVRQIALQVSKHFSIATGGRMTVQLSGPMAVELPSVTQVTNALAADAPLTPGSVITISGDSLAVEPSAPPGDAFVTKWNGSSVTIAGEPALLRQVAPDKLEAKLPAGVSGDALDLVVTTRRGASVAAPVSIGAPSLFLLSLEGRASAVLADGTPVTADTPAAQGASVTITVLGLEGLLKTAFAPGSRIAADTEVELTGPVTVSISGVETKIDRVVLARGLAGRFLLTFAVPAGLASGDVEMIVKAGELTSNPALLAVAVP